MENTIEEKIFKVGDLVDFDSTGAGKILKNVIIVSMSHPNNISNATLLLDITDASEYGFTTNNNLILPTDIILNDTRRYYWAHKSNCVLSKHEFKPDDYIRFNNVVYKILGISKYGNLLINNNQGWHPSPIFIAGIKNRFNVELDISKCYYWAIKRKCTLIPYKFKVDDHVIIDSEPFYRGVIYKFFPPFNKNGDNRALIRLDDDCTLEGHANHGELTKEERIEHNMYHFASINSLQLTKKPTMAKIDTKAVYTKVYTMRKSNCVFSYIQSYINITFKTDYALSTIKSIYYKQRRRELTTKGKTASIALAPTIVITDQRKPSADNIENFIRKEYGLNKDVKLSIDIKIG